jgi:carbon-monoxide dehydrogenase medium subunit
MKPPRFEYHRPSTRDEVTSLLAEHGDEAKILAGGQSLVPMLNFRLAHPAHLIDINHLEGESTEPEMNDRWVTFDPLVRHVGAERSAIVEEELPLLFEALHYVAHPAIRTRGTIVGSVAHSDPAAEIPAVLTALGGEIVARSAKGQRTVHSDDCFVGPLVNALEHDEWMEAVRFPRRAAGEGFAFEEFSRRSGDYALCGVAAVARPTPGGMSVSLAYLGVGVTPQSVEVPARPTAEYQHPSFLGELEHLVAAELKPYSDIHATGAYKLFLAVRLGTKAARRAVAMGVPA